MVKLKEQVKALAAIVVGIIGVAVTRATSGEAVVPGLDPFDVGGWLTFLGVCTLAYFGVFLPGNALGPKQLDFGLKKLPAPQREAVLSKYAKTGP